MTQAVRRSTTLTLDGSLVDEARSLGLNLSRAAEAGVAEAIRAERARRWRDENAEAIRAYNAAVERDGLPLAEYRKF
jgi:antitoxin CcdA